MKKTLRILLLVLLLNLVASVVYAGIDLHPRPTSADPEPESEMTMMATP